MFTWNLSKRFKLPLLSCTLSDENENRKEENISKSFRNIKFLETFIVAVKYVYTNMYIGLVATKLVFRFSTNPDSNKSPRKVKFPL